LLTLLFLVKFYFREECITAHLLSGLEAEPVPGERHIIFIETRCVLSDSVTENRKGLAINQRQACAVASAANTNPDSKVYLLYTCSIICNLGDSPEYVKQMFFYTNVRIWKLVISDYIKGTPLETWDLMAKVRSSKWPVAHASDILRIITLWKYGGTYLDMDFVMRKSLVQIGTNYAGAETEEDMANGALSFDMDTAGRRATDLILTDFQRNFNGKKWSYNGPKVILRVLEILCGNKNVTGMTREKCSGIAVLPPSVFYSIPFTSWKLFFNESRSDEVLKKVDGSYGVHVWNKMSSQEKVIVGSKQAYGLLAEKYCPQVYRNCGPVF